MKAIEWLTVILFSALAGFVGATYFINKLF